MKCNKHEKERKTPKDCRKKEPENGKRISPLYKTNNQWRDINEITKTTLTKLQRNYQKKLKKYINGD